MAKPPTGNRRRLAPTNTTAVQYHDHDLLAIVQRLPGRPPTDARRDLYEVLDYETRFWRCRACGEERNRPDEFSGPCPGDLLPDVTPSAGYSMDELRTRRAIAERMTVEFLASPATYRVRRPSGAVYRIDLAAETCTCPDHREREVFCKHLRRVDLEVRAGIVPQRRETADR